MAVYGASFDIARPEKFDRTQIFIRILIILVLSLIGFAIGWLYGAVYVAIPVAAAILISQRGAQGYLSTAEDTTVKWIRYIIALYAYLGVLTDRLPNVEPKETFYFDVQTSGEPTPGRALLRIILVIPHAFVLGVLSIISGILLVIAVIMVLVQESYPEGIYGFQRAMMRWSARVFAYTACLVDEYPPFALDTQPEGKAPSPATRLPEAGTPSP